MDSDIPPACPSETITTASQGFELSGGARAGIGALVITIVLLVVISILVAVIVVQRKSWKKQKQAINSMNAGDNTYSILAYNSKL